MPRYSNGVTMVLLGMTAAVAGCSPCNIDIEQMKAMLPPRTAEFDALDMLAGSWTTSGQVRMTGLEEPIQTRGTSEAAWTCDRRLLVEHSTFDMGDLGSMGGMSVWTWDPRARRYRMWWFDSFGESATGTARYDEATRTWRIKTVGRNTWSTVRSKGTIQAVGSDRLEWSWSQRDGSGLFKIADMRGSSRRMAAQQEKTTPRPPSAQSDQPR